MNIFSLVSFFSFLVYISLGFYTLLLNPKSRQNRLFFLLSLCFAVWSFAYTFVYPASSREECWTWYRVSAFGWCLFPSVGLHYFLVLTDTGKTAGRRWAYYLLYTPGVLFWLRAMTGPMLIIDFMEKNYGWAEVANPAPLWILGYTAYYSLFVMAGLCLVIRWGKGGTSSRQRRQAWIITLTGFITLSLSSLTNILLPVLDIHVLPAIGGSLIALWYLGMGFAIVRYRLMALTPALAAEEIISRMTDFLSFISPEGKIIKANERLMELLGYGEDDLAGQSPAMFIREKEVIGETLRGRIDRDKVYEVHYHTKGGEAIPVNVSFTEIIKSGEVIGIIMVGHDRRPVERLRREIAERGKAEEALRMACEDMESRVQERTRDLEKAWDDLKGNEDKFRLITENMLDILTIHDAQFRYLYVSPSIKVILGYEAADMLGQSGFDLVHPDDRERAMQAVQERVNSRSPGRAEVRLRRRDGQYQWFECDGNLILGGTGEIENIVVSSRDITERMKIEGALKESEEKYRTILESIEDGFFEVDLAGSFTFFNNSMIRILGYTSLEMKGMNYHGYMDEQNAKMVFEAFNGVYRSGVPTRAFDWELLRKDGERISVEASVSLIRDDKGGPVGFRGVVRDITERKRIEEKLRRNEERYRRFVDHAGDIIYGVNADGFITFINPTTRRILKFTEDEMLGRHFTELVHPDYRGRATRFYLRQFRKKTPYTYYEVPIVAKDGQVIWFGQTIQLILQGRDLLGSQGIARDITERKKVEDQLRESEERYRTITENSSDIVCELSNDARFLYVNRNFREILGYDSGELLGKSCFDMVHPRDLHLVRAEFGKKSGKAVYRYRHRVSGWRWFEGAFNTFRKADGDLRGVLVARDITDRKLSEDLMWQAEIKLRVQQMALAELAKSDSLFKGDMGAAFRQITRVGAHNLDVERVSVWLFNQERTAIHCATLYEIKHDIDSSGQVLEVIQYPEYFRALGNNPLIVASDARSDPRTMELGASYLEPLGITSLMDVPIRLRGETSGIICHEHVGSARNWLPEEQSFAASLAELASLAMEAFERNRAEMALRVSEENLRQRNEMIERDLKNAQIIQKALLPSHIPQTGFLKIDYRIFYMDAVGGDYFSFTNLREGGLGIFIGDVSGHGVSAALFLSLLKSTADRICRKMGRTPSEFIRKLNVDLIDSMQQYFVTAIYGIFNDLRVDGYVRFTFAKGGHPEPILYRAATGEVSLVKSGGTILSKFANAQYQETTIDLRKGDRLFLYTDGIPETRNAAGQIIGFSELPGIIKGVMKPGLGETLDAVLAEVNRFRGDTTIDDDIVLIGFEAQ